VIKRKQGIYQLRKCVGKIKHEVSKSVVIEEGEDKQGVLWNIFIIAFKQ
jgi:hypothetical protein